MGAPSSEFSLSCGDGHCEDRKNKALETSCSVWKPKPFVLLGPDSPRKIKDPRAEMAVTGLAWATSLQTNQPIKGGMKAYVVR